VAVKKKWVAVVLLVTLPLLLSVPPLQRGCEALQLLMQMDGVELPGILAAVPATRQQIEFTDRGHTIKADLYRGEAPARAAIVLQHGAAAGGKDDARLVTLAGQLAQARFAVLVPEMPGARALQISSDEIPVLQSAVDYLQRQGVGLFQGPIGIGGFSVAAGLAIHAAMLPSLRERVDFILAVGSYYDLRETLHYMTTGSFMLEGELQQMVPNDYGKWVFVLSNLDKIADAEQRVILRQIATSKRDNGAYSERLVSQLGGEALATYRYVTNREIGVAPGLLEQLPVPLRAEVERLDLANKDLSRLRAKLLLVHGIDDNTIPYSQSIALYRAVPESQSDLYLLQHWAHADPQSGGGDSWTMLRVLYRLLQLRDGC
jgi:fermentation-respiration switch protein FrsA (DUF1100 family)